VAPSVQRSTRMRRKRRGPPAGLMSRSSRRLPLQSQEYSAFHSGRVKSEIFTHADRGGDSKFFGAVAAPRRAAALLGDAHMRKTTMKHLVFASSVVRFGDTAARTIRPIHPARVDLHAAGRNSVCATGSRTRGISDSSSGRQNRTGGVVRGFIRNLFGSPPSRHSQRIVPRPCSASGAMYALGVESVSLTTHDVFQMFGTRHSPQAFPGPPTSDGVGRFVNRSA